MRQNCIIYAQLSYIKKYLFSRLTLSKNNFELTLNLNKKISLVKILKLIETNLLKVEQN